MEWVRLLAYITGTVEQELLLRHEYPAAENRILRAQIKGDSCCRNRRRPRWRTSGKNGSSGRTRINS
jgi:hypothetical protein